jgi:predicted CXXCH cytochrome family protein
MVEDFTKPIQFYHKASDQHFTVYERDGKYYQRRHQVGFDGSETNVVEKQVDFVVGSGNHARTYLHRTPEGRIFRTSFSLVCGKGRPLGEFPNRTGVATFRRLNMAHPGRHRLPAMPRPRPWRPENAVRCRPGRFQVDFRIPGVAEHALVHDLRDGSQGGWGGRSLDSSDPGPVAAYSGSATRVVHAVPSGNHQLSPAALDSSTGPGAFSYRPGEPVSHYALHFDHAPGTGHDDKFEIAHHAYRLRKSACFEKSGGQLTCTTCHDPHDAPRGEAAVERYTRVCSKCHASQLEKQIAQKRHTTAKNCLECHMPKRRTDDVIHVVMTDHYIQRRKPARDLLAPLQERHVTEETAYHGPVILLPAATTFHRGERTLPGDGAG